jgi:hypothetical protein
MKFFILGMIYVAKKLSPYSYYNIFILKINYSFTYKIISFGILSDFKANILPFMFCSFANSLLVFFDQIPRLMTFTFLEREDKVQREIKKIKGYENEIDIEWLADEYMDVVVGNYLAHHSEGRSISGFNRLENAPKDIELDQMFKVWGKHNDGIYLELKKENVVKYHEAPDKIEQYGVMSIPLRNFLRRYVI